MTEEELNEAKHQLERQRFEFDKERSRLEDRFLRRNSATIISAFISVAVLGLSVAQVWQAHIDKQREREDAIFKQSTEMLRQKELDERQWNYDSLRFVADNKEILFGPGSPQQTQLINVMVVTFPSRVLDPLLRNFREKSANPDPWKEGEKSADARNLGAGSAEDIDLPDDILINKSQLVKQLTSPERLAVSNALVKRYAQNPKGVVTALTDGTLDENDPNSYRNNLYIAVTLGRIPNQWQGPKEKITALTQQNNYRDSTFKKWVDIALRNHKD